MTILVTIGLKRVLLTKGRGSGDDLCLGSNEQKVERQETRQKLKEKFTAGKV